MYELRLVRERRSGYPAVRSSLPNAEAVARAFRAHFEVLDREQVVVLLLNTKNKPIGFHTVSIGTLNASLVHPREVFKAAIVANAAAAILLHNHPSGDPLPSVEDYAITERLLAAGKLLGIALLDSIVVGDNGSFFSFSDAGRLENAQEVRERAAGAPGASAARLRFRANVTVAARARGKRSRNRQGRFRFPAPRARDAEASR